MTDVFLPCFVDILSSHTLLASLGGGGGGGFSASAFVVGSAFQTASLVL